jgi:hypothetical protein
MKKLVAPILSTSVLVLMIAGFAVAGTQADIGFKPNRMFFRYTAPGMDSGNFQVLPENRYNPIVLPCGVQVFQTQIDINADGAGLRVFPKVTVTFFDDQNNPIVSSGCLKDRMLPSVSRTLNAMTPGSVQTDSLNLVSSVNQFCDWLFQPSDLPADKVIRIHEQLAAYSDDTHQGNLVDDPNPANNAHDVYVRRSCSLE